MTEKLTLKTFWSAIPPKKRFIWTLGFGIAFGLMTFFVIWLISFSGTAGLLYWVDWMRNYYIYLVLLTVFIPIIGFVNLIISKKRSIPLKFPHKAIWAVILVLIIVPTTLISFIANGLYNRPTQTPIQLVMLDGTGMNRIPDFAVLYYTRSPSIGEIKWGLAPDSLINTYTESKKTNTHALLLQNLQPETRYFYSIDNGQTIYNFTTFSSQNSTFRFSFTSDGHFGKEASNATARRRIIEQFVNPANGFDAFFLGGDIVEMGFQDSEWQEALKFLSPYTTQKPFRTTIGNHDNIFGGDSHYKDYFYNDNAPLQTGSQMWYHISINDIHLFFLDLEWDTKTYTAEQQAWFEREVAKLNPDDWIIVFSHSYYYSSGVFVDGKDWSDIQDMIEKLTPVFEANGVDLVFSGHNHHFEHLTKDGVNYNIVGGFGGVLDPERDFNSTLTGWYHEGDHGFVDVKIQGNSATVIFNTPENTPLYNYTISK
jgi:hypothetical protein